MYEKTSQWLTLLERVIELIRPKSYNTIAKLAIFSGVGLIVESQVNFVHALVVALFEKFIGRSELLREFLIATDNPSLGVFLVIAGMVYHLLVTLGKDFIKIEKSKLPKQPELLLSISTNTESNQYHELFLDGPALVVPKSDKIFDYEEKNNVDKKNSRLSSIPDLEEQSLYGMSSKKTFPNTNLYRERAEFIESWSGFEPLKLKLSNQGEVLANGVRVQVVLPKGNECLSIIMPEDKLPSKPKKTFTNEVFVVHRDFSVNSTNYHDKMSVTEDEKCYKVDWDIKTLQAGVIITGNKEILIKVKDRIEIKYTVFCDELSEPKSSTLILNPPKDSVEIHIDDIINDEKFNSICDQYSIIHAT